MAEKLKGYLRAENWNKQTLFWRFAHLTRGTTVKSPKPQGTGSPDTLSESGGIAPRVEATSGPTSDQKEPLLPAPIWPRSYRQVPVSLRQRRSSVCRNRQSRHNHNLIFRRPGWAPESRRFWKSVGQARGWKHPRPPSVRLLSQTIKRRRPP